MSGLFGKAMKDANFSVTATNDGSRTFDSDDSSYENRRGGYRGRNRGRSRGRGRGGSNWRGSNWRGGRGGYRGRGRSQSQEAGPRSYLAEDDGDESMEGDGGSGKSYTPRFTPYGPRPPSRRGFRDDERTNKSASDVKSRLGNQFQSGSDWHKVSVIKGKHQDKDWLIKRIQSSCEEAFQPKNFHYAGDSALFFVEGKTAAEAIKKVSHQITIKNGSKLIISVRPSDPPQNRGGFGFRSGAGGSSNITVNPETEQVLRECLSNRYDAETKTMDLSSLFFDEVLKANNIQGHIYKPQIAGGILKLIGENCQDMECLDLSNNRLYNLDTMKELASHAPNIKQLKLSNNQFKSLEDLDKLKGLHEVVTMDLSGNPLCDKYESGGTTYINAVRSRFPKVTTLDGTAHAPPIGFDLAATTKLPKVQDSYMGDPAIKQIIVEFLRQYFTVYDSGDRQALLDAYHEQAMFSLSVNTGQSNDSKDKGQRGPSLGEYMKISRNMLRRKEADHRASLMKNNRLSVVALLNELPPTTHDLPTLLVDVHLALSTCLSFSIQGFFMEANKTPRSFTRVFVAVPNSSGKSLQIVNDQLHVRSPTLSQIQSYQKQHPSSTTTTQPTPSGSSLTPSTLLTSSPPSAPNLTPEQQQMVTQFSRESNMNAEWSYKCLSENAWNYQKSAAVFTDLNSKGSIPPDAFTPKT